VKVRRRVFLLSVLVTAFISGCAGLSEEINSRLNRKTGAELDGTKVAAGLREALGQGTSRAVQALGREGGFWSVPNLRIPVPDNLRKADAALRRIGQARLADDFVRTLNRAAEQATPAARQIFTDAIRGLTIRDAIEILRGPPDAATTYFRRQTEAKLTENFRPIVARSTNAVGVTATYKRVVSRAAPLGLIDTAALDIDSYVTREALNRLFELIAREEGRIRADPAARTSQLLREVFR